LSGSVVVTSIMPTESPVSSSVCASCIGMTTNRLVIIIDADLEDRGDAIGDLARHRAERGGLSLRIDDGDRCRRPGRPDCSASRAPMATVAGARLQFGPGCPPSPCGWMPLDILGVLPRTRIASTRPLKLPAAAVRSAARRG
jgi:hypothetical protein